MQSPAAIVRLPMNQRPGWPVYSAAVSECSKFPTKLAYLSSSLDLANKIVGADLRHTLEQPMRQLLLAPEPAFGLGEAFAPSSFNHISQKCPRCAREADERHLTLQAMACERDSFVDIVELVVHIEMLATLEQCFGILIAAERGREVWPCARQHLDGHSHGLGHNKNIAENDRRVKQARVSSDRLQSDFASKLWGATDFEKVMLLSDGSEPVDRLISFVLGIWTR